MNKIQDTPCRKCGGDTSLKYKPSCGMDIEPTGLFKKCSRCGFSERVDSLDEKFNA
jgi:ribosomal protein L37E